MHIYIYILWRASELTIDDVAKNNVLAVQPRRLDGGQKELRAVGVGASVGHGQDTYCWKRVNPK